MSFLNGLVRLGLFLLIASSAHAGEAYEVELASAVPGKGGVTYLDLARMVMPDLVSSGQGHLGTQIIEMRPIGGGDSGDQPPESFSVWGASALNVTSSGRKRLLLMFDLGNSSDGAQGFAPLALYDLSGKPKLLDVVNVASDRSTSFRDPASLAIGPGDDAIMTVSSHFNSSQGYAMSPLMMVPNDRIELIDTIYTFDENLCGYRRTQEIAYRAIPEGKPYSAIEAIVTETTAPGEDQCDEPPPAALVRQISVTYHWDATTSGYTPDSDAFEKLSAENAERF